MRASEDCRVQQRASAAVRRLRDINGGYRFFFTIGCEETPHDGGFSYAFDDTFSAELRLLPQSLTARSAEADREGGTTRVWPNRATTRGQICPKAEYSVRKERRF